VSLATNLNPIAYYTQEWAFIQSFKHANDWVSGHTSGTWDDGRLVSVDENGWVTSLLTDQRARVLLFRSIDDHYPAGQYVFLYDGTGTFSFDFAASVASSEPGRIVLNVTPASGGININLLSTSAPPNHARNFRLIMPGEGYEENYNSLIFHPSFLNRISPYRALRFMDWLPTNHNNQVKWDHRTKTTFARYDQSYRGDLWVGTFDGTDTYTNVSVPSSPNNGDMVQGEFTNANTITDPTLEGKTIKRATGSALSVGTIAAASRSTLVYDTYLDSWLLFDEERLSVGVPVETMVELCNRVNRHGWFCMPHMADDDYVQQFAAYVFANLDPGLRAYVEYSNEVWNSIFTQAGYCENRGIAAGLSGSNFDKRLKFYGRRSGQIFDIWATEFASARERLITVLCAQASTTSTITTPMNFEGTADKTDVIGIAPYFAINANLAREAEIEAWTLDDVFNELVTLQVPTALTRIANYKATANSYGKPLVAYEGGQHLSATQGVENNTTIQALFNNANRDSRMGDMYRTYLRGWRDAGGDLFYHFNNCGTWNKWGSWGALEYLEQPTNESPKYSALMEYLDSFAPKGGSATGLG
jgi:hypothetical protein